MAQKSKKKYTVFFALVISLLFFSSPIVARLSGMPIGKLNVPQFGTNDVLLGMNQITNQGGLAEVITISGWAFCETTEANDAKEIYIIFSSEDNSYSMMFSDNESSKYPLLRRYDVVDVFPNHNIVGVKHGFTGSFSTLTMKNGTYDVCVGVKENDQVSGLIKTNKVIIKNNREIMEKTV